ncbi:MAG TPA: tetratricopeptide repeat protein, partial [Campylobacterales bacterium]|nr:tetratricopeptide repeat protein [Campylobacterales bacterium]
MRLKHKLKLSDIEETLKLRKELSSLIALGVSSKKLGDAFVLYISSLMTNAIVIKQKNTAPLSEIVAHFRQNQHSSFYILDLFSGNRTQNELDQIVADLNFYRDYIWELGLKIALIASCDTLQYIYSNAYDFISFNNFIAYFEDDSIDVEIKADFSKLEEATRDCREYLKQPRISIEIRIQKLYKLASLAYQMSDYRLALRRYQELLKLSQKSKNRFFEATSNAGLAGCFIFFENYPQAFYCAEESARLFRDLKHRDNEANGVLLVGEIYLRKNDFDKALSYFQRALALLDGVNTQNLEATIMADIGRVYSNKFEL